jgi:hypothetical protein
VTPNGEGLGCDCPVFPNCGIVEVVVDCTGVVGIVPVAGVDGFVNPNDLGMLEGSGNCECRGEFLSRSLEELRRYPARPLGGGSRWWDPVPASIQMRRCRSPSRRFSHLALRKSLPGTLSLAMPKRKGRLPGFFFDRRQRSRPPPERPSEGAGAYPRRSGSRT